MNLTLKKMKWLALFLISRGALAMSMAAPPPGQAQAASKPVPYCEVNATFAQETSEEETIAIKGVKRAESIVGWIWDVNSARSVQDGPCPAGSRFTITIRPASHYKDDQGNVHYAYFPGGLHPPAPGSTVTIKVTSLDVQYGPGARTHHEWRLLDNQLAEF